MTTPTTGNSRTLQPRDWGAALLLAVVTFGIYVRTAGFDFIGYDDQVYVSDNPYLERGITLQTLHWAMTAIVSSNWHPLTLLTELVMATLFGTHPGPFHILNALLHALNAALFFAFLRNSTGRFGPALFAAALWGLHPLRVESVAWISELKDVLCGTLWLSCMLAYLRYVRHRTLWRYMLVLLLHALALSAKPMAVTLPAALLLLDFWPLANIDSSTESRLKWWLHRLLEKMPFGLISVAAIAYAIVTQQETGATHSLARFPIPVRIENALVSVAAYLRDTLYPNHLAIFYPHPAMLAGGSIAVGAVIAAASVLLLITAGCLLGARSKPYLATGWFWFVGTLVPVLGLLQVGEQSRADRYTYLPSIGLNIAVVWLVADLVSSQKLMRIAASAVGIAAAIALAASTWVNIGYWQNASTLFAHADQVVPNNYLAKAVEAFQYHLAGNTVEALRLSEEATTLAPDSPGPRFTHGLALLDAGQLDRAAEAFSMTPMNSDTWYELGLVKVAKANRCLVENKPGETEFRSQACDCFRRALRLDRDNAAAQDSLADQTAQLHHLPQAIEIWRDLIQRSPAYGPAHGHLGDALLASGKSADALEQYRLAILLGQRDPAWESRLAYHTAVDPTAPAAAVRQALAMATDARDKTGRKDAAALDALSACQARLGQFDDAITNAQAAINQARLVGDANLAKAIQRRLIEYQNGRAYFGDDH